jgi:hypothetical protein
MLFGVKIQSLDELSISSCSNVALTRGWQRIILPWLAAARADELMGEDSQWFEF